MAGDWIPIGLDLPRKREVLALSRLTGLRRREVVGILVEFWGWASGETADGVIEGVTIDELTTVVDGTKASFWQAMLTVGWLHSTSIGLVIPNAEEWITKGAKARLKGRDRQRESRSGRDAGAPTVTPRSRSKRDNAVTEPSLQNSNSNRTEEFKENGTGNGIAAKPKTEEPEAMRCRAESAELLVSDIVEVTGDATSKPLYRKLVQAMPAELVYRALAETRATKAEGGIRTSPGALFTSRCKTLAAERGIPLPLKPKMVHAA